MLAACPMQMVEMFRPYVLHRVVDCQTGAYNAPWGVDVEMDVFVWIFRFEEKHLGNDHIGYIVRNCHAEEYDSVSE